VTALSGGCPLGQINDTGGSGTTPTAAALFSQISQTDPYTAWDQFPEAKGVIASATPHGPMARVFINDKVNAALSNFDGALPDGSVIVKENIGASSTDKAENLTIMWKVAGFNPDAGDWFWAMITPEGSVLAEGAIASCIGCHGGARANDYVFLHAFVR